MNSVCKDTLPCNHRGSMDYLIRTGPICRCSRKFYVGCEDGTTRHLSTFRSGSRDVRKSPRCILWSPAASLGLGSPPHRTPRQHRKEFSVGCSTRPGALKTGWRAPEWPRCGGCGVGGMQEPGSNVPLRTTRYSFVVNWWAHERPDQLTSNAGPEPLTVQCSMLTPAPPAGSDNLTFSLDGQR